MNEIKATFNSAAAATATTLAAAAAATVTAVITSSAPYDETAFQCFSYLLTLWIGINTRNRYQFLPIRCRSRVTGFFF